MRPLAPRRSSTRGTALVIAVGLLSVLAVIGFGFAVVMRLHHTTSRHYRSHCQLDMLSQVALCYALDGIRYGWSDAYPQPPGTSVGVWHSRPTGAIAEPTEYPRSSWYVGARLATSLTDDPSAGPRFYPLEAFSYCLPHDVLGDRVAYSYVRVIDSASKINLNDDIDGNTLRAIVDALIDELNLNGDQSYTGHPEAVDTSSPTLTGTAIIDYRDNLTDDVFTSLEQLLDVSGMTPRRYEVLRHHVTIYSWPHGPESVDGYVPGYVKPDGSGGLTYEDGGGAGSRRSPININTASRELLTAVLAQVQVPLGGGGHSALGRDKARQVARWIVRKRDHENQAHWRGWDAPDVTETDFTTGDWHWWLTQDNQSAGYRDYPVYVRNPNTSNYNFITAHRHYPLGPFDSWNELAAFLYFLTDDADTGAARDPFPDLLDPDEAEAILASTSPNPLPSVIPHNTWHMGYSRGGDTGVGWEAVWDVVYASQRRRDKALGNTVMPEPMSMDELPSTGCPVEFTYCSLGRYEIDTRTFAFVKSDYGKCTAGNHYGLQDTSKVWSTAPTQWRGSSVIIYDGKGQGQMRGIATNTGSTLTVARWSITPDSTSRYYICGPGAAIDRVDEAGNASDDIGVTSGGAVLTDEAATWEDDQWNGYRVVVYRADFDTETISTPSGTKTIQHESIYPESVQERFILDTVGTTSPPRLIVSPPLDTSSTPGSHWSYIILGARGSARHQAAVKAYDVIHHTSEDDFAPPGHDVEASGRVRVGPSAPGATRTKKDGFIAVGPEPVVKPDTVENAFVMNFASALDVVDEGGTYAAGNATAASVFSGGNLVYDGLHLPSGGTASYVAYNADTTVPIVTKNASEEDTALHTWPANGSDGGYVSFWFRPDADCFEGTTTRTLLRIVGDTPNAAAGEVDDLRVQIVPATAGVGPTLRLVLRSSGKAVYSKLQVAEEGEPDEDGNPTYTIVSKPVTCRQQSFVPPTAGSVSVELTDTTHTAIYAPWEAGQWHHITFAWFESYNGGCTDNDTIPVHAQTDYRCDDPANDPKYSMLDDQQVKGCLKLWVDGRPVGVRVQVNAFNLLPPASTTGVIHVGEIGHPPAGTVDGILAYAHSDQNLNFAPPQYNQIARYKGNPGNRAECWSTYQSPSIPLPTTRKVCLGTARFTVLSPIINFRDSYAYGLRDFPAAIEVTLSGSTSVPTPRNENVAGLAAYLGNACYGEGGALRSAMQSSPKVLDLGATIRTSGGANQSLSYTIDLTSYHQVVGTYRWYEGEEGATTRDENFFFPRCWQTPVVEDVTITYLGPIAFLYYK